MKSDPAPTRSGSIPPDAGIEAREPGSSLEYLDVAIGRALLGNYADHDPLTIDGLFSRGRSI